MFIVLEGIDGCGKTTQADNLTKWLAERLGASRVLRTFEPGDWSGGRDFRSFILDHDFQDAWSEFFMFMADRCEHVARTVRPALENDGIVVCDRYMPSTMAYQIYGGGVSPQTAAYVAGLSRAIDLLEPDIVLWLDADVETAAARLTARGGNNAFDGRGAAYFRNVRDGYAQSMATAPACTKWFRIDAAVSEGDVFAEILRAVEPLLKARATR